MDLRRWQQCHVCLLGPLDEGAGEIVEGWLQLSVIAGVQHANSAGHVGIVDCMAAGPPVPDAERAVEVDEAASAGLCFHSTCAMCGVC